MINTARQLMHNIRLFCGTHCSATSSWRQARTKIFRTTDEADTAHVVSELPTAREPWSYLFSRLHSNRHITCVQCERATLPILNHMPQTFSLLYVFCPVLSKGGHSIWPTVNSAASPKHWKIIGRKFYGRMLILYCRIVKWPTAICMNFHIYEC